MITDKYLKLFILILFSCDIHIFSAKALATSHNNYVGINVNEIFGFFFFEKS